MVQRPFRRPHLPAGERVALGRTVDYPEDGARLINPVVHELVREQAINELLGFGSTHGMQRHGSAWRF